MGAVYAFSDVHATLTGPGGVALLGDGSASAEGGISFEDVEEKDVMVTGADGAIMHSLIASNASRATVRLLKTSPVNAILMQMYNLQKGSSLTWAQNIITLANPVTGDATTCRDVAFSRRPPIGYGKEGPDIEWEFLCGSMSVTLGQNLTPSFS